MKNRILMLLDNPFTSDRRVQREATSLNEAGFSVTVICTLGRDNPIKENCNGVSIYRLFSADIFNPKKIFSHKMWAKKILEKFSFDIVHCHDQTMLSIGANIKKRLPQIKLIYDSHELFHSWPINSTNFESWTIMLKSILVRKYFIRRELKNSRHVDYIITVNDSIASNLRTYFHFENDILVIRNCPEYIPNQTKSNVLREKFNISPKTKILVFIGANIYLNSLNIEQVFQEFKNEIDVAIVVISKKNEHSIQVMNYVKKMNIENVHFHDKIKPKEINEYLSSADVGLVPTWNKNDLSYWFALDNKLFEYIQARIPVLATCQPEYVKIIDSNKCGVCINADEKNAYINGYKSILSDYKHYQSNSNLTAKKVSWNNEKNKIQQFYKQITNE
jgi:alpha-maltose-1-phosphate synthase